MWSPICDLIRLSTSQNTVAQDLRIISKEKLKNLPHKKDDRYVAKIVHKCLKRALRGETDLDIKKPMWCWYDNPVSETHWLYIIDELQKLGLRYHTFSRRNQTTRRVSWYI